MEIHGDIMDMICEMRSAIFWRLHGFYYVRTIMTFDGCLMGIRFCKYASVYHYQRSRLMHAQPTCQSITSYIEQVSTNQILHITHGMFYQRYMRLVPSQQINDLQTILVMTWLVEFQGVFLSSPVHSVRHPRMSSDRGIHSNHT